MNNIEMMQQVDDWVKKGGRIKTIKSDAPVQKGEIFTRQTRAVKRASKRHV